MSDTSWIKIEFWITVVNLNPFHRRKRNIKETKIMSDPHLNFESCCNLISFDSEVSSDEFHRICAQQRMFSSLVLQNTSFEALSDHLCWFSSFLRWGSFFLHLFRDVILVVLWIPRSPFPHVHVCCCGCFLFLLWKILEKILGRILEILILEKSWKNPGPGFLSPSFWWFSFSVRSVLCVLCVPFFAFSIFSVFGVSVLLRSCRAFRLRN